MTASLPEKQQALETLIDQSILIDVDKKQALIEKIPEMDEVTVTALGKFLASEVKIAGKFYDKNLGPLNNFINQLEQAEETEEKTKTTQP